MKAFNTLQAQDFVLTSLKYAEKQVPLLRYQILLLCRLYFARGYSYHSLTSYLVNRIFLAQELWFLNRFNIYLFLRIYESSVGWRRHSWIVLEMPVIGFAAVMGSGMLLDQGWSFELIIFAYSFVESWILEHSAEWVLDFCHNLTVKD